MKTFRDKLNYKKSDATDISKPWDKDNQAWWDWYVGLADNGDKKDPIITAEPLPDVAIPTDDEVVSELAETYPLKNDQINFFRKNGFIKLNFKIKQFLVILLKLYRHLLDQIYLQLDFLQRNHHKLSYQSDHDHKD